MAINSRAAGIIGPYLPNLEAQVREYSLSVSYHGWMDHGLPRFPELYETSSAPRDPLAPRQALIFFMA